MIKKGLATPFSLQTESSTKLHQQLKAPIRLDDAFGNFLSGTHKNNKQNQKPDNEPPRVPREEKIFSAGDVFPGSKRSASSLDVDTTIVESKQRRRQSESDEDYQIPSSQDLDNEGLGFSILLPFL